MLFLVVQLRALFFITAIEYYFAKKEACSCCGVRDFKHPLVLYFLGYFQLFVNKKTIRIRKSHESGKKLTNKAALVILCGYFDFVSRG